MVHWLWPITGHRFIHSNMAAPWRRLCNVVRGSNISHERIKESSSIKVHSMTFQDLSSSFGFNESGLEDARPNQSQSQSRSQSQSQSPGYNKDNQYQAPPPNPIPNRPLRGRQQSQRIEGNNGPNFRGERVRRDRSDDSFLEKFKLSFDKRDKPEGDAASATIKLSQEENKANSNQMATEGQPPLPEDADQIFKKMKETGLIPNAVAMLDGLCKDGLVQEAMKLFGLMREKGSIPEVVIYTAVVEGFCKAQKFDDAKRIFRKMQNNGITPNAFSFTVLIQGLYRCDRLEDALEFCEEMIDAGHSPNVTTFVGLVNGVCKEKGVEEAQIIIGRLREKGYVINEKAVREFLEKKAPFSSMVWEAIFGKKQSHNLF
ncbi:pentatricopeptide repeat-containing protein At4g38150 isoform X2 [Rhodamnia argentea]|uniref:Pentatricopeptide repeat-containing protein At4g38150 isoform X2 n=1 Tax=Rhodamnia argentea TaxID=178133 RepID=A0ABM3GUC8_9MYRT|nr:pentatricopeptide repeat-containing protein At4g38150 isoform X2 [Rhodamnia argentea]